MVGNEPIPGTSPKVESPAQQAQQPVSEQNGANQGGLLKRLLPFSPLSALRQLAGGEHRSGNILEPINPDQFQGRIAAGTNLDEFSVYMNTQMPRKGADQIRDFLEALEERFPNYEGFRRAARDWIHYGYTNIRDAANAFIQRRLGNNLGLAGESLPSTEVDAWFLLYAIDSAPLTDHPLFRGRNMSESRISNFAVGTKFETELASTSGKEKVAGNFTEGDDKPVMFILEPGAKAIRTAGASGLSSGGASPEDNPDDLDLFKADEWLTGGQFEVTNVERPRSGPVRITVKQLANYSMTRDQFVSVKPLEPGEAPAVMERVPHYVDL